MGDLGGNQPPVINGVFVETNLVTRLVVPVVKDETISSFKDRFREEHHEHFTETGEINIDAVKVKCGGCLYELSNHMKVSDAFDAISRNWFLYVDAAKVEKENPLAIVVASQNCWVEGNQEVGSEKTRAGKRKVKSSEGKRGRKKRVTDDGVNQSAKVEKEDLLATVVADQKCSNPGLVGEDREIGVESVLEQGLETQVPVAEKTKREKRTVKISEGKKSRKKRVSDDVVNQSATLDKDDLLATMVDDQKRSNPLMDSVLEETQVAVADKTTRGKREVKSSDGKKSRKRSVIDERNEVEAVVVVDAPISEVLPRKEVDDVLSGALGKENETGEESVEDNTQTDKLASQPENHLEKKRNRKSKKAKRLAKGESVPILVKNLEPMEVVDGEEADNVIRDVLDSLQEMKGNLDKMEDKSTKISKRKHVEKIVESQVEVNSASLEEALPFKTAKDTDALFMSPKDVAGNSEDNQSLEVKADMGDTLSPSQKDHVADGGDKRRDHVIDAAKSKEEKKGLDMHHDGSINGSVSSKQPKEKVARSKVDHSAEVAVDSKKEAAKNNISNSIIDGSLSSVKPKEKRSSDVSSGAPSNSTLDDDESDVNSVSRKQGNNLSVGGAKLSLADVLRRSASYKKAKLSAEQSQAEEKLCLDPEEK
ncbi:unnamed protein product [Microthlaspi erraticum]|uniref:Uncharacterized protein n=1 Tax=Microthlaspi erraticum TaxID=1685480 RepID=A0A6D2JKJ3_9BRAS|nr:unnamed protein product [Microthlaspi erraticum]